MCVFSRSKTCIQFKRWLRNTHVQLFHARAEMQSSTLRNTMHLVIRVSPNRPLTPPRSSFYSMTHWRHFHTHTRREHNMQPNISIVLLGHICQNLSVYTCNNVWGAAAAASLTFLYTHNTHTPISAPLVMMNAEFSLLASAPLFDYFYTFGENLSYSWHCAMWDCKFFSNCVVPVPSQTAASSSEISRLALCVRCLLHHKWRVASDVCIRNVRTTCKLLNVASMASASHYIFGSVTETGTKRVRERTIGDKESKAMCAMLRKCFVHFETWAYSKHRR